MDSSKLWAKFLLDKVLVLLLGPPAALILAVAWVGMLVEGSPGPFLHVEDRWSQGRPFRFYKVRSQGTRIGALLKKYYLDELPQLWHVAQGHMTLVGPRPVPPDMARYAIEVEGMVSKKLLRAGLTGMVQVRKLEAREREVYGQMEREYFEELQRRSAWGIVLYDLGLLWATVPFLLKGENL